MTTKVPKLLQGLWDLQYAPLEKYLKKNIDEKTKDIYEKMPFGRKISVLDKIAAKLGF